jgi:hypothetical protein
MIEIQITPVMVQKAKAKMPKIDWALLKEETDNVEGAQMLACSAGVCEI